MKQFTITIQDKEGLHARPAGLLSKAAKGFQCAVTLTKGEKTADLKKIFAVMGLAVKGGDSITVACDGADEEAAAAALEKLFSPLAALRSKWYPHPAALRFPVPQTGRGRHRTHGAASHRSRLQAKSVWPYVPHQDRPRA